VGGVATSARVSSAVSATPAFSAPFAAAAAADDIMMMHVDLPADDPRTVHVATVLQLQDGDAIRTGRRSIPS
jgi:hypothetical protein